MDRQKCEAYNFIKAFALIFLLKQIYFSFKAVLVNFTDILSQGCPILFLEIFRPAKLSANPAPKHVFNYQVSLRS